MENKEQTKENFEEVKKEYKDVDAIFADPSIVEDNKIYFYVGKQLYRVCMPNQRQRAQADREQQQLYGQLLNTPGCYLLEKLKEILKNNQGLDLDELELKRKEALKKFFSVQIELSLIPSEEKEALIEKEGEVIRAEDEVKALAYEVTEYTSHSIENRCEKHYVEYLTHMCTEKKIEENDKEEWVKVWNSFREFEETNLNLEASKAINRLTTLLVTTREQ